MIKKLNFQNCIIELDTIGTRAYENILYGRDKLTAECPPEIVAEVLAVWGDTPTMPDAPPPQSGEPTPAAPTLEQRTAALESAMLAVLGGGENV